MMKPAFSTVTCPEWTIAQVAERAQTLGFEAVELRTFGEASTRFACDPALTSGEKVRRLFNDKGIEILSLATGERFDAPVRPPVIGFAITDTEKSVRAARRAIDLAVAIECPLVRVFAFDLVAREKRARTVTRIAKRLAMVTDHAHNTGIRVVVENGGGFCRAEEIAELITQTDSPLLGACYSVAVGHAAGESPADAVAALGDRLWLARVKDLSGGKPCPLGQGDVPCQAFVSALLRAGFDGPLVFEWDRAWFPGLDSTETVLKAASAQLWSWLGGKVPPVAAAGAVAPAAAGRR